MLAALVVSLAAPLAAAVVIPPVAYKASLHPSGDCGRCLTAVTVNGVQSAVVTSCNLNNPASYWYIADGATYIMNAGNEKCLTGAEVPSDIWSENYNTWNGFTPAFIDCPSPNWPAPYARPSAFYWMHLVDKFSLPGGGEDRGNSYCLDLKDGNTASNAPIQVWTCYAGNKNQEWTIVKY